MIQIIAQYYIKRGRRYIPTPPIIKADPLIAICAFRYALGRRTYVVSHVAEWLIANADKLRKGDPDLIVREIDEYRQRWGLGDACDMHDWTRVREHMAKLDATQKEMTR